MHFKKVKQLFGTWEVYYFLYSLRHHHDKSQQTWLVIIFSITCDLCSPPVWLCWRVLSECHTPSPTSCNLVRLYGNIFNLNYTFRSVGTHCLNLSVRNNISNLQTSHNIYVLSSRKYNTLSQTIYLSSVHWKSNFEVFLVLSGNPCLAYKVSCLSC